MGKRETVPLAIAAREAYAYQRSLGNLDDGDSFDAWRHAQVQAIVGKPGLTACHHADFRPLMAAFQELAGKDDDAFEAHMTTGAASPHPGDTHEDRRQIAHLIVQSIEDHQFLADHTSQTLIEDPDLRARARSIVTQSQRAPFLGRLVAIKASIETTGVIRPTYVIALVKAKTSRPNLRLTGDLRVALAARCTLDQLDQILSTVRNRIAAHEGRGDSRSRNQSQRSRRPSACPVQAACERP